MTITTTTTTAKWFFVLSLCLMFMTGRCHSDIHDNEDITTQTTTLTTTAATRKDASTLIMVGATTPSLRRSRDRSMVSTCGTFSAMKESAVANIVTFSGVTLSPGGPSTDTSKTVDKKDKNNKRRTQKLVRGLQNNNNFVLRVLGGYYCDISGMGVETTNDVGGGTNLGWIDANDWVAFDVELPAATAATTYQVTYRVASPEGNGALQLEAYGGTVVYGKIDAFPKTGGWQNWATVSHSVQLPGGRQTLAIKSNKPGWNFRWLEISGASSTTTPTANTINPVKCTAKTTPGSTGVKVTTISADNQTRIEAEAYCDMFGVEKQTTSDVNGGENLAFISNNDWMAYYINVMVKGEYEIQYRVASLDGVGSLELQLLSLDNQSNRTTPTVVGKIDTMPRTGDWQRWDTVKHSVTLSTRRYILIVRVNQEGWNLNWLQLRVSIE